MLYLHVVLLSPNYCSSTTTTLPCTDLRLLLYLLHLLSYPHISSSPSLPPSCCPLPTLTSHSHCMLPPPFCLTVHHSCTCPLLTCKIYASNSTSNSHDHIPPLLAPSPCTSFTTCLHSILPSPPSCLRLHPYHHSTTLR